MSEDHVSDLKIDRMLAGELTEAQRLELTSHTKACSSCAARVAAITTERDAFSQRPIPITFAKAKRSRVWIAAPIAALAAAAVLVLVLRPGPKAPVTETERPKGGGLTLLVYAGAPDHLRLVSSPDVIRAGEYLQVGYTSDRDGFGAVLSIDGAGKASIYVPATGDAMVPLPAGRERSFPGSTLLDDVIGHEQIALVWCAAPHPLAPMLEELRTRKEIGLREECTIIIETFDKKAWN